MCAGCTPGLEGVRLSPFFIGRVFSLAGSIVGLGGTWLRGTWPLTQDMAGMKWVAPYVFRVGVPPPRSAATVSRFL